MTLTKAHLMEALFAQKHQRAGRNPQTGEPITLPPEKVATFKCSKVQRAAINGEED